MTIHRKNLSLSAAMLGCLLALGLAGQALAAAPAAGDMVKRLQAKAKGLKSYSIEWSYDGRNEKTGKVKPTEKYKLDFLVPNLRRMTVVQKDFASNGAVIIYNPAVDKLVVAKKFLLTRKFPVNDKEISGYFDTDLASIAAKVAGAFAGSTTATSKEVTFDGKKVIQVSFKPKAKYTQVSLWIDAQDNMPRQVEFWDAKGLQDRRHFTAYSFASFKADEFKH